MIRRSVLVELHEEYSTTNGALIRIITTQLVIIYTAWHSLVLTRVHWKIGRYSSMRIKLVYAKVMKHFSGNVSDYESALFLGASNARYCLFSRLYL